ncbi:hypothetical protein MKW98_008847 [Papaver atlanticum]|uniref:Uncharacterized protein n=1 Tax=Papaver atlanticum TaxID=357466 RepID=A0AAD4S825_9MAGN|nr:hypothetical protein MKW98_008847 [Papaver atlanticum]
MVGSKCRAGILKCRGPLIENLHITIPKHASFVLLTDITLQGQLQTSKIRYFHRRSHLPQQFYRPPHQPSSHLARVLSWQQQALQASFQSSQQAFSQLQKRLHMMQQSGQNLSRQHNDQATNYKYIPDFQLMRFLMYLQEHNLEQK